MRLSGLAVSETFLHRPTVAQVYCMTDSHAQALLHSYENDPMGHNPIAASKGQINSATGQRHAITDHLIGLLIPFFALCRNALIPRL